MKYWFKILFVSVQSVFSQWEKTNWKGDSEIYFIFANDNIILLRSYYDLIISSDYGKNWKKLNQKYLVSEGMGSVAFIENNIFNWATFGNPILQPDGSVSYSEFMTLQCQDKCSWLYSLSDNQYNNSEYYGKDAIFELIPDSSKNRNDILMKLIDKVDYIDCIIFSPINSDKSFFTIYNMLGVSMENIKINVKKGINNFKINTLNYYPGLYIIQLTINGTKKLSDKFIIIR